MASQQLTVILQNNGTRERNIRERLEDIRDTRCIEIGYRSPYSPKTSGNSSAYNGQPLSYKTDVQSTLPIQHKGNFVLLQRDSMHFP